MGRQAPRRELRDRRPRPRLHGRTTPRGRARRRPLVSRGDARVRVDEQPRRLVLAAHRRGDRRAGCAQAKAKKQEKAVEHGLAKARTKDSMKAFNKLTNVVDGEVRIVSDPPLIVPIAELAEGRTREAARGGDPRVVPRATGARCKAIAAVLARELPRRRSRAQGGRRRQRRHASLDPAACSDATTRTRSSSRSRRRRTRCSSRSSARASSATTDSASSRGSA